MSTTNSTHWRCRWFGHKFEGRWSTNEKHSFAPAALETVKRTDLDELIRSTSVLIFDARHQAAAVASLVTGAVRSDACVYHGDVCVRCGEERLKQSNEPTKT